MNPKEKAIELIGKYYQIELRNTLLQNAHPNSVAQQCALIAVDEIVEQVKMIIYAQELIVNANESWVTYWYKVKCEIVKYESHH